MLPFLTDYSQTGAKLLKQEFGEKLITLDNMAPRSLVLFVDY